MNTLHFIGWWFLISLIVAIAFGHACHNQYRNDKED